MLAPVNALTVSDSRPIFGSFSRPAISSEIHENEAPESSSATVVSGSPPTGFVTVTLTVWSKDSAWIPEGEATATLTVVAWAFSARLSGLPSFPDPFSGQMKV